MPDADNAQRAWLRPLMLVAVLLVVYVLSYAPVYRLGKQAGWCGIDRRHAIYRPVEWLIDNTPLNEPLYRWADCWGVRGDLVWAAAWRAFDRGQPARVIATEAETPHLYEHVIDGEHDSG